MCTLKGTINSIMISISLDEKINPSESQGESGHSVWEMSVQREQQGGDIKLRKTQNE